MDQVRQDVLSALRQFRRAPGTACVAIVTLALGIGANTAVFSVASAVLLRALPYRDADRLITVAESSASNDRAQRFPVSPGDYLELREQARTVSGLGAFNTFSYNAAGSDAPERLIGAAVSANLLPTLGIEPALGRGIRPDDDRPDAARVVVLSDRLWRRRFAADPAVVGRTMRLNGEPHTVVGVMPRDFRFPAQEAELWVAIERQLTVSDMRWRNSHYLTVIGRLREGAAIEAARAEMNALMAAIKREHPDSNVGSGAVVERLQDELGAPVRPALVILLAAVTLVLVVTCANVGNLLLAQASARQREVAVRVALGAGRRRIAQQFVTEALVLAAAGGAAGIALAAWIKNALVALAPEALPQINKISIDGRVLAATIVVSTIGGLAVGLVPAAAFARGTGMSALRTGVRSAGVEGRTLRHVLVGFQIAACVVLVAAATLLVASFVNLRHVDLTFDAEGITTARITLPDTQYENRAAAGRFFDRVMRELRQSAAVADAALATHVPLTGTAFDNSFEIEGRPLPPGEFQFALIRMIDDRFLPMFGIPVVAGRNVSVADTAQSPPVVLINEAMARRYWPGSDPIGRRMRIQMGDDPPMRQVVGIVRDVRVEIAREPEPTMYVPFAQLPSWSAVIAVRGGERARATAAISEAARRVDPQQPIYQVRDLRAVVALALRPWQFSAVLIGGFALLAVVICVVGVASVASYAAAQRTREIGVRLALGATRGIIIRWLVREMLRIALVGTVAGAVAAFATTRTLGGQLYGVAPGDPRVLAAVVAALIALPLVAAYIPAARACRLDPAVALRAD